MNKDEIRGLLIGQLNALAKDRDSFEEEMEEALEDVRTEAYVEDLVEELIQDGWIEYIPEGNNLRRTVPESEKI